MNQQEILNKQEYSRGRKEEKQKRPGRGKLESDQQMEKEHIQ